MVDESRKPIVLVFAGPNGSGKTTITRSIPVIGAYVNADDIKKNDNITDLEAAIQAEATRNMLLDENRDFTFETVMSTERNLLLLQKAKTNGYEVQCIYVLTCSENINVARVKSRYAYGGHDVPEDKVRERYHRALALLPRLIDVCDKMLVYDNSERPSPIFYKIDKQIVVIPNNVWSEPALRQLFGLPQQQ